MYFEKSLPAEVKLEEKSQDANIRPNVQADSRENGPQSLLWEGQFLIPDHFHVSLVELSPEYQGEYDCHHGYASRGDGEAFNNILLCDPFYHVCVHKMNKNTTENIAATVNKYMSQCLYRDPFETNCSLIFLECYWQETNLDEELQK